jgi:hypothetical protein
MDKGRYLRGVRALFVLARTGGHLYLRLMTRLKVNERFVREECDKTVLLNSVSNCSDTGFGLLNLCTLSSLLLCQSHPRMLIHYRAKMRISYFAA